MNDPNRSIVRLRGIGKEYRAKRGKPVVALKDVNLDITHGEVVTLVGPSGCGKSTLLRLIGDLHAATEGEIEFPGHGAKFPRNRLGIVYQQPLLLPWKNVIDNVLLPIRVQRKGVRSYQERAQSILKVLGLERFADAYPHQLSGGMQQRVGIARALIQDPDILLMDEPFGALDAMTRDVLTDELLRIHEEFKTTIVFVTHSIPEAVLLADRVVVMTPRPGQIARIIPVDLPRPRALQVVNSEEFGVYSNEVRAVLDEHLNAHTESA